MKKIYFTFAFSLLINCVIFGQKFQPGYVTFPSNYTTFVDIQLTSNNKPFIKYQYNGKTVKAFKIKLKDYGTIIDGQQKSDYANSAFKKITFDAYFVSKETGDTSQFYFLEHTYDKIIGYLPDRGKLILYPKDIVTVSIDDDETRIFYDGLLIDVFEDKKSKDQYIFLKKLTDGRIFLYEINETNSNLTVKYIENRTYFYDIETGKRMYSKSSLMPEVLALVLEMKTFDGYILRKKDELFFTAYVNTQDNGEQEIKEAIQDYPYLANKIGKPGYQFIDILDILEEYNSYWEKRQK
jgi:hypothetical protein